LDYTDRYSKKEECSKPVTHDSMDMYLTSNDLCLRHWVSAALLHKVVICGVG